MTLTEIYTEIIKNFVGKEATTDLIARVTLWINNRQKKICETCNFYFMEETGADIFTVNGTQSYFLTTPCPLLKELRSLGIVIDTKISSLTKIEPDSSSYFIAGGTKERPTGYWLEGDKVYLDLTPDAVYTLKPRYYKWLADLGAAPNDTNEITKNFPQVLIDGATADGMKWLKEDSSNWEEKFQAGVIDMIRANNRRKNQDRTIKIDMRIR